MSVHKSLINTYQKGGFFGVYHEGIRFLQDRPARIKLAAMRKYYYLRFVEGRYAVAHPLKIIELSPNDIVNYYTSFDTRVDTGSIELGDWDRNLSPVEEKPRFRAVYSRYRDGCSWEETGIIDYYYDRIEECGRYDGCYSREDVEHRYQLIDQMYESMQTDGYRVEEIDHWLDHICVHITRNGEVVHAGNGNHRLAIAQVLELDTIPVRVVVRHGKWQALREHHDCEDVPRDHPDLRDLK